LSQENQSFLRFSLEESLWFRKGQEVAELVSISLDPDITIQENDQYVIIRGSLELTGEYNSYNENQADEEESNTTQKYVQSVEERDGGVCEFSHRFPVDITIPNNRIQSIYDIDVFVDSFDYSIPERSCLKLSAELTISGLYGVKQDDRTEESNLEVVYRAEEGISGTSNDNEGLLFEAEARKQPEDEKVKDTISFPTFPGQPTTNEPANQRISFFKKKEEPKETESDEQEQKIEDTETIIVIESSSSSSSSSSKDESSPKQEAKKTKAIKKKSMSLTEFFARKEGEDEQAKMKICIVQKGDTLDRVAERYDVTIQNLLRINNLEINHDVSEGQVLYIPVSLTKK
jgi:stage VI sporulation protein D